MGAFEVLVAAAGVVAGAIASVAGFGVGSVLTPLLGSALGLKLAVAAASIPHVVGTALRLWIVRADLDRRVLLSFGLTSMTDPTTGLMALRTSLLAGLSLDPVGWKIVLEIVVKAAPIREGAKHLAELTEANRRYIRGALTPLDSDAG